MGISQRVHVIYGWIIPTHPFDDHLDETEWTTPTGFTLIGMDSEEVAIGPEMFVTTDIRWDALEGTGSFTENEAKSQLSVILSDPEMAHVFEYLKGDPKFHAFVNCT